MDLKTIATEVSTVDEVLAKLLPFVSTAAGFVPGNPIPQAVWMIVGKALLAVDNAAKAVAAGNPNAAIDVVVSEVKDHLTPNMPNSPILSPTP
jgi:hypothetical protein